MNLQAASPSNARLIKEWKKSDNQLYKISLKETKLTNQKLQLELALDQTSENIKQLTEFISEKRDLILRRIRYLNQGSGSDFLKNLIESSNPGELDRNMKLYSAATQSDLGLIQQYNKDISKLKSEQRNYAHRISKLKILKYDLQKQAEIHKQELKRKNEILSQIKSRMKLNSTLWKKELQLAIKNKNNSKIHLYQSLLNKNWLDRKGQLTAPSHHSIKYGFGAIKFSPTSPTLPFHGILFDSPAGAPVRAIADGSIVWLGHIDGLGDTVILDHGRDLHSLYARVTLAKLHLGDMIEEGTIFGRVATAPQFISNGLYFELREHGHPTNPLRWILSKPEFLQKDSSPLEYIQ